MAQKSLRHCFCLFLLVSLLCSLAAAQAGPPSTVVPQLVSYSGKLIDGEGKPIVGLEGVTFAIYKDQSDGSPLWMETQNVEADAKGNYTVQLGANSSQGIPLELFASGEARWLAVRVNNGGEQARMLLLSVPYALKAADAQTVGGLPASAFVLAVPGTNGASSSNGSSSAKSGSSPDVGGTGTQNYIPIWTDSVGDLGNSVLYQSGSGSTANVGFNTTTPATTLDVNGTGTVRGLLTLPASGTATATAGKNSQPERLTASAYNSGTRAAVNENFQWQAEPAGNNTTSPSGTFNLLFGSGTTTPAETGLHIASNGQITFAPGQTFPGTGGGSVTSVGLSAPSSDFTVSGSPVTSSGTLGLNWTVAPTNADTASAIVKRDVKGAFSAGEITATAADTNPAIAGTSTNVFGTGVFGSAPSGSSSPGTGVVGQGWIGVSGTGSNVGVSGTSTVSTGVTGNGPVTGVAGGGGNYGVTGTATGSGNIAVGVYGTSTTSTKSIGVYGSSNYTGTGVYGLIGSPSGLSGTPAGVWGDTLNGTGVYGSAATNSSGCFNPCGFGVIGRAGGPSELSGEAAAGVWGDATDATGVLATSSEADGLDAFSGSTEDFQAAISGQATNGASLLILLSPFTGGNCYIDPTANFFCSGSKSAVVPVSNNRQVALYAVEAPENWFEDFGSGQLVNGAGTVMLDPTFAETVNLKLDYHVFLTPRGDCKGLYVERTGPSSFEVRELSSGTSSVSFDYRIVAKRLGYESKRLVDMHEKLEKLRANPALHKLRVAKAPLADASSSRR